MVTAREALDAEMERFEREEAQEVATRTVLATLDLLKGCNRLDHEDLGEVLHMLTCVLRNPEVLT